MEQGQELRQRMNEHRRHQFGEPGRLLALLCECGDSRCSRTVVLSAEDYDARRPGLLLHPDHGERLLPGQGASFDGKARLSR